MKFKRYILSFELGRPEMTIEYRKRVLSFLKKTLSEANGGKYFEKYFGSTAPKDYCFSVVLPDAKYTESKIIIEENIIKVIFSADNRDKTDFVMYCALLSQKNKTFPLGNGNCMVLKSIKEIRMPEIKNSRMIFKTSRGSSICVREHNRENNKDKYYIYSDDKFREKIKEVLALQLRKVAIEDDVNEIKINPIQCKKVVVKHYGQFIDTSVGIFEISAKPYILQYLLNVGIGSRKSAGFGMIDLVTQELF